MELVDLPDPPGPPRITRHNRQGANVVLRYLCPILVTGFCIAIWRVLTPEIGSDPFPVLLVGIAISSWYGGLGPGLLATGLGFAATVGFGAEPVAPHLLAQTGIYGFVAAAISWPHGVMNRFQNRVLGRLEMGGDVAHALGEALVALDDKGHVRYMNPAAEELLGWPAAALTGRDLHDMVHQCRRRKGPLLEEEDCPIAGVIRSGLPFRTEEESFRRQDGVAVPVSFSLSPIMKGSRVTGSVMAIHDMAEQQESLNALRDSEEYYRLLLETSPDSIVVADLYSYIIKANQRAAQLYGYESPDEMLGVSILELVAPEDRTRAARDKRRTLEDGTIRDVEYMGLRKDGTNFAAEVSTSVIVHPDGRPKGLMAVARDRTQHKRSEERVRQSEAAAALQYAATAVLAESASLGDAIPKLLQTLGQGSGWDVALFWGANRKQNEMRCRFVWRLPKSEAEEFDLLSRQMSFVPGVGLPGRVWETGEPLWIRDVMTDPSFTRALAASKSGLHTAFCLPIRVDGNVKGVIEFFSRSVRDPNLDLVQMMQSLSKHIGQFIKRREQEEALEHAAYHDPLTDLANRLLFKSRLDRAILASWAENTPLAVLLMDLNKFKHINDTYGHHYGDEILQQTALRLRRTLRDTDTVARLGGDEFAVLLAGTDPTGARIVADKIVNSLTQPVDFEGKTLRVGTSIGIAMYPEHGEDTNTLLQHADAAMYFIKRAGGGYALYEASHDQILQSKGG